MYKQGVSMIFFRKKSVNTLILLFFSIKAALASQSINYGYSFFDVEQYNSFITLTAGPDFVSAGQVQTLQFLPSVQNDYTGNKHWKTVADLGVFIGVERIMTKQISAQLGVAAYADSVFSQQGTVVQFTPSEMSEFPYSYRIRSTRIMLSSKLLTTLSLNQCLRPYFSWEIGAGFNRPTGYNETPTTSSPVLVKHVSDKDQASFAWGVGIGMDYTINKHIRAGLGYQFANLGSASQHLTQDGITTRSFDLSHLYTNQLRFQLTFLV